MSQCSWDHLILNLFLINLPERADIVGMKLAIKAYLTITSLRVSMMIPPANSRPSVVIKAGSLVIARLT